MCYQLTIAWIALSTMTNDDSKMRIGVVAIILMRYSDFDLNSCEISLHTSARIIIAILRSNWNSIGR